MWLLISAVKFVHVACAILMIVGLVGRESMRVQVRRSRDVQGIVRWVKRSGYFERFLVIPPSQGLLVAGIALAWLQGWPLFGFLQGASANWLLVSFAGTCRSSEICPPIAPRCNAQRVPWAEYDSCQLTCRRRQRSSPRR